MWEWVNFKMYSASLMIVFLTSSTKLALCTSIRNGIHYSINGDMDGLVCPVDDRSSYNLIKSESRCSVKCITDSQCQYWVYEEHGLVCYTCSSVPNNVSPMNTLPDVKNWQLSGCDKNVDLVSGPHGVQDQAITASSFYEDRPDFAPSEIKFTAIGWASNIYDKEPYVQISFQESRIVSKVCTKGMDRSHLNQYVTNYQLMYGQECDTLFNITDNSGNIRVFPGNYDRNTAVCADLNPPIKMKCLRVNIQAWNEWCSMRFEAIGCIL